MNSNRGGVETPLPNIILYLWHLVHCEVSGNKILVHTSNEASSLLTRFGGTVETVCVCTDPAFGSKYGNLGMAQSPGSDYLQRCYYIMAANVILAAKESGRVVEIRTS